MSKSEPLAEGTVIMAEDQYAGRGQQDNRWSSEPGKNVTMSLLLKPSFLDARQQFEINICISLAVLNALKAVLGQHHANKLKLKWPNDIYFNNRKLGGLLIENMVSGSSLKQTVAGIGINVNQIHFSAELADKATSIHQILQRDVEKSEILAQICNQAEASYLRLRAGSYTEQRKSYVQELYKLNEDAKFRQNGEVFDGRITGITTEGKLLISQATGEFAYNFKEVEFLNQYT